MNEDWGIAMRKIRSEKPQFGLLLLLSWLTSVEPAVIKPEALRRAAAFGAPQKNRL